MGIEYRHYVIPRDVEYEPDSELVFRVDSVLRSFGLSDELPLVIDHDEPVEPPVRAKRRGRASRDTPRPREAAYEWSLDGSSVSESVTAAAFDVFGSDEAMEDAIYLQPVLYVGPAWKVLSVVGVQSSYVVRAPASPSLAWDWGHVAHVFAERPDVEMGSPLRTASDLSHTIDPLPDDWIPPTFRVGLVLDFFKSIPNMANERVPRLPARLREALEREAFGARLAQGFGWS